MFLFLLITAEELLWQVKSITTLSVALTNTVDFPFGANYNVMTDYVLKTILNGIPLISLVTFDDELNNIEYIAFS